MPPFREGPVIVENKLSPELLFFLRDVGHGHRINIVDASYDIPKDAVVIDFPGTTAEAYEATIRLIPVNGEREPFGNPEVTTMEWDGALAHEVEISDRETNEEHIAYLARKAILDVGSKLIKEGVGAYSNAGSKRKVDWTSIDLLPRLDEEANGSGFYTLANNPEKPHTFIRTQDDLPFACVSLVVGHSQRTE